MSLFKKLEQIQNQAPTPAPVAGDQVGPNLDALSVNPPLPAGGLPNPVIEPPQAQGLTACPTCAKEFKHIKRHKCKVEPAPVGVFPLDAPPQAPGLFGAATAGIPVPAVAPTPAVAQLPPTPPVAPMPTTVAPVSDQEYDRQVSAMAPPGDQLKRMRGAAIIAEKAAEARSPGYTLLLDAVFEKGGSGVQHFADIIHPLAQKVAAENNVCAWNAVEYGNGVPQLAAKLEAHLASVTGIVIVDTCTPEARACLEVLRRMATTVVVKRG